MILPPAHPQRLALNDEVHARPPEPMAAPLRISYIALLQTEAERQASFAAVVALAQRSAAAPPLPGVNHFSAQLGAIRLVWESHTEFSRFMLIRPGAGEGDDPFAEPAIGAVPPDWVQALPGQIMVATHLALLPGAAEPPGLDALAERLFHGHTLIGARISGGAARAYTDFRIHPDGFGRILVEDEHMTAREAGRLVQGLLEIDTYRMLALLALPLAREVAPHLVEDEQALAEITAALIAAREADEPALLERLTGLAAGIASREARTLYRFGASNAYYSLVQRRITDLREGRLEGAQTWQEFTERRLAPAVNTSRAMAQRQDALSRRVARATALLTTRVELTREQQTQAVLASLDRRVRIQLRLQQTVEGLSVAAITYYIAGLAGYVAKGAKGFGVHLDPEVAVAVVVPVVAVLVWWSIHRMRRAVMRNVS